MRIYVIFTGGTIGSSSVNGIISPDKDNKYKLIDMYQSQCGNDQPELIPVEAYRILSENLNGYYEQMLINKVNEICSLEGDMSADGIVVTHGTDTLQYSAAILGYVFADSKIPIMLVSSDFCLEDSRANGLDNFKYALEFINNKRGKGVFVSYKNVGGLPVIHRGTRLQSPISYSADVDSIKCGWFGRYVAEQYVDNPGYKVNNTGENLNCFKPDLIKLDEHEGEIVTLRVTPGMRFPKLDSSVGAILLEAYHSGTIAVNETLKEFMKEAKAYDIPVYLTGLSGDEAEYETVEGYRREGVIPLADKAFVSQYCKLWLCLSLAMSKEELKTTMGINIAEEV